MSTSGYDWQFHSSLTYAQFVQLRCTSKSIIAVINCTCLTGTWSKEGQTKSGMFQNSFGHKFFIEATHMHLKRAKATHYFNQKALSMDETRIDWLHYSKITFHISKETKQCTSVSFKHIALSIPWRIWRIILWYNIQEQKPAVPEKVYIMKKGGKFSHYEQMILTYKPFNIK